MANKQNDTTPVQDSALPKPKKNGWLYIYVFLGVMAVVVLVLTAIYREQPRRAAIAKRSKIHLKEAVYALVISPLDSATARSYTEQIARKIGADSLSTKMVINSTFAAQQFASFAEFRSTLFDAMVKARPASLRVQTALTTDMANSIVTDKFPSTICCIGELGADNFAEVKLRLNDAINAFQIRHQTIGPLSVWSFPPPTLSDKRKAVLSAFFNTFREHGMEVKASDTFSAL